MNQKKNAFTLIELLAVIVILAIIALIAVPVIMNIINKANKSAFKDTAYGVIQAGELYFAEQQLNPMGMSSDVTIQLPDTTKKLELKGEVPEGSVTITKDGKISIAVHNGRYCVTKGFDDTDVTVTEDYETCKNPSIPKTLSELATTGTIIVPGIATDDPATEEEIGIPACLTDGTMCTPGTPIAIKVNETETYTFYVISETNNEVTLIMDRNLGDNVAWYADASNNSYGPITAVAALKERTAGWTNIPEKEYTYSDDGEGNMYTTFTETMKSRMLTYTETTTLGCTDSSGSCPSWLYINLYGTGMNYDSMGKTIDGYWTSAAKTNDTKYALTVTSGGRTIYNGVSHNFTSITLEYGIRPVITLSK